MNIFADGLQASVRGDVTPSDIFNAVRYVHRHCSGSYAVVVLVAGQVLSIFSPLQPSVIIALLLME